MLAFLANGAGLDGGLRKRVAARLYDLLTLEQQSIAFRDSRRGNSPQLSKLVRSTCFTGHCVPDAPSGPCRCYTNVCARGRA